MRIGLHLDSKVEQFTQVSGLAPNDQVLESRFGQTVLSMKAPGHTTKPTVTESSSTLMGTFMKVNGKMTELMAKALIDNSMEVYTRACGKTTSRVDMAGRSGQMKASMKAT